MLSDLWAASLFVLSFFPSCLLALFYPGNAFRGSGGWLSRGEREEWLTEDPGVVGVEAVQVCSPGPPGDEVEPNWFVNVEPSGTNKKWGSNLFSSWGGRGPSGQTGWITHARPNPHSSGFYDTVSFNSSATFIKDKVSLFVCCSGFVDHLYNPAPIGLQCHQLHKKRWSEPGDKDLLGKLEKHMGAPAGSKRSGLLIDASAETRPPVS